MEYGRDKGIMVSSISLFNLVCAVFSRNDVLPRNG